MEFDIKKIQEYIINHKGFIDNATAGTEYYKNDNDIRAKGIAINTDGVKLRNADNRISHNWHELLVNQKAAYLFTYPPLIDLGDDATNKKLTECLGDKFPKVCKDLCVEASNTSVGWLHYWINDKGEFKYALIKSEQIIPIYADSLDENIVNVIRIYKNGNKQFLEFWSDKDFIICECDGGNVKPVETITHTLEAIPFVPFYNNSIKLNDLHMYKDLIDQYDRVISGYCNDIDDIQEVIYILKNYGGVDLKEFMTDLKRFKAVKVNGDSISGGGGVETMQIDIPVEARTKLLEILRKQIFVSGQGVDPDMQNLGNTSGVALKYLYSLLELKAGLMETEFRLGFAQFIRAVLHYLNVADDVRINQTYTRNIVTNDLETTQIATQSAGIISQKTILANHPWVENVQSEIKQLKEENAQPDNEHFGDFNNEEERLLGEKSTAKA